MMESVFSGEFQRSTRMPLDAVVRLHFEGTVAYQNGFAANVSATGMFVKHPAPPPVGTRLVFEFNIGAQRKPVQGAGEVVWVRDRYLGPGQPAGIGIRFAQIDAQSRDHIAEALFEYLEQSLSEEMLSDADRVADDLGVPASVVAEATASLGRGSDFGANELDAPEPLDLADIPPLPAPEIPRTPPPESPVEEEKHPFEVFSTLEQADPETQAIVREAMRDEPVEVAGAAAVRRGGTSPWVWALLVVALAGAGYYAWQRWGTAPSTAAPAIVAEPPKAPVLEPLPAVAADRSLAEAVGVDTTRPSPASAPTALATEPPPADEPAVDTPVEAPVETPPSAVPPAPPVADLAAAKALLRIEARDEGNLTLVTLTGNGAFLPGAFSYSEIGGDNPRVLIKLKGMTAPYRGAVQPGTATLRGVRTGFHVTNAGNEVHVVLDLVPDQRAKVSELTPEGDRLVAVLMR